MSVWMLVVSCMPSPEPSLRLDGPAEVRVRSLGPVDGPQVVTASGEPPDGMIVTLSRDGVARVDGEQIVAVGPGEVTVAAEWEGSRVEWVLSVDVDTHTELTFVSPPSTVGVGVAVQLRVAADGGAAPSAIVWSSSDARVLAVDARGTAVGVTAGVAYVTARAGGASAMVEVEVVP